jgi:hypothetical protein
MLSYNHLRIKQHTRQLAPERAVRKDPSTAGLPRHRAGRGLISQGNPREAENTAHDARPHLASPRESNPKRRARPWPQNPSHAPGTPVCPPAGRRAPARAHGGGCVASRGDPGRLPRLPSGSRPRQQGAGDLHHRRADRARRRLLPLPCLLVRSRRRRLRRALRLGVEQRYGAGSPHRRRRGGPVLQPGRERLDAGGRTLDDAHRLDLQLHGRQRRQPVGRKDAAPGRPGRPRRLRPHAGAAPLLRQQPGQPDDAVLPH